MLISRSSRDSATTGLGNSGYQSTGERFEVKIREQPVREVGLQQGVDARPVRLDRELPVALELGDDAAERPVGVGHQALRQRRLLFAPLALLGDGVPGEVGELVSDDLRGPVTGGSSMRLTSKSPGVVLLVAEVGRCRGEDPGVLAGREPTQLRDVVLDKEAAAAVEVGGGVGEGPDLLVLGRQVGDGACAAGR